MRNLRCELVIRAPVRQRPFGMCAPAGQAERWSLDELELGFFGFIDDVGGADDVFDLQTSGMPRGVRRLEPRSGARRHPRQLAGALGHVSGGVAEQGGRTRRRRGDRAPDSDAASLRGVLDEPGRYSHRRALPCRCPAEGRILHFGTRGGVTSRATFRLTISQRSAIASARCRVRCRWCTRCWRRCLRQPLRANRPNNGSQ